MLWQCIPLYIESKVHQLYIFVLILIIMICDIVVMEDRPQLFTTLKCCLIELRIANRFYICKIGYISKIIHFEVVNVSFSN